MNNIDTTDLAEGRSANRHVEVRLMNPDSASVLWKTVHYTLLYHLVKIVRN